jgi:hypothetical protein
MVGVNRKNICDENLKVNAMLIPNRAVIRFERSALSNTPKALNNLARRNTPG